MRYGGGLGADCFWLLLLSCDADLVLRVCFAKQCLRELLGSLARAG